MPLTEQEARCIDLTCRRLAERLGGTWQISEVLDETYQSEASPEVLVSNGSKTAAIEVKRLLGDDEYLTYIASMFSLEKYLTPSCGGYYSLGTAVDFRTPMEGRFKRHVKKEIESVAPTLAPEQAGAIRIPRQAHVSLSRDTGPGYIFCCHNSTGHFVQEVSSRITGAFLLVDDGQWEHEFVTDEAKRAFQDALVAACETRLRGEFAPVTWTEEWPLTRGNDDGTESGVWLIAVTGARSVQGSVAEAVDIMLEKAKRKFEERRWADLHVLVFDNASALMTVERVAEVVAGFEPEDLGAIDLILVADDDAIAQVWPHDLPPRSW